MATFAILATGIAVDPIRGVTLEAAKTESLVAEFVIQQITFYNRDWELVPDFDTTGAPIIHGAVNNGDGTFTNPVAPVTYKEISKTAFMDLAWAQFGGGTTGMARFNSIMKTCQTGSDLLQAVYDRYTAAQTFVKEVTAPMLSIMVASNAMTSDEANALLSHWPTN